MVSVYNQMVLARRLLADVKHLKSTYVYNKVPVAQWIERQSPK